MNVCMCGLPDEVNGVGSVRGAENDSTSPVHVQMNCSNSSYLVQW